MELSEMAGQNNRLLKDLVKDLRIRYSPASIRLIVTLAKQILESAKNSNGLPLYPMQWSSDFIDLPVIAQQKQPTVTSEEVESPRLSSHRTRKLLEVLRQDSKSRRER